jgi:SAM-dependent methyltransferase
MAELPAKFSRYMEFRKRILTAFRGYQMPVIEQSREKLSSMQGGERASFVQADLCDLAALSAGQFHLALALGDPIGCTAAPAKALKEIRRLLADGGVLIATFDNRLAALDFYLERGDLRELEEFLRTGKTHWLTREHSERFDIHTYTPAQARKLLEAAGFEVIDMIGKTVLPMRHHRGLLEVPDQRRHWARIEKSLWRDAAALGRASHLQVAARIND